MGTQTYGKGIIQTVISLDNDRSGFQMTYAQYFLPSGQAVHKVGITPDVIAEFDEEAYEEDETDTQLNKAIEVLKEKMK